MKFVTTSVLLQRAIKEGYAVGGFDINNMESIQAVVWAAAEESSPVILSANQKTLNDYAEA